MATFEIIEGQPGQGKSLYTARLAKTLCERNKKWFEKTGTVRKIASNVKFSSAFEEKYKNFILYWADVNELIKLRDVDVLWDEIATELDARNYANLSNDLKRWLSQYRKRGVDVYANTQDFSMVDARCRLMITKVRTIRKLIGSRDPSATKPNPKYIWGVCLLMDVKNWRETDAEKKKYDIMSVRTFLIERADIELYDTRQDIAQSPYPPLKKITRICPEDGYTKTTYV